jgi:hypothetical protein
LTLTLTFEAILGCPDIMHTQGIVGISFDNIQNPIE